MSSDLVEHLGSCHCGKVKFSAFATTSVDVYNCNCSICKKKQNRHFIIPLSRFKLLQGEEALITYRFKTGVARHRFCSTCGVQCFYHPRSNPDGVGIAPHCLDSDTLKQIRVIDFDGQNWEESMQKDDSIKSQSQE